MQTSDKSTIQSFTRRAFLLFSTAMALIVPGLFRRSTALPNDDELIIVNGWILRKSDLIRSSLYDDR